MADAQNFFELSLIALSFPSITSELREWGKCTPHGSVPSLVEVYHCECASMSFATRSHVPAIC